MTILWLAVPTAHGQDLPQNSDCGGPQIIIEGGKPPQFSLADQVGETIEVSPGAVLTIRGVDLPADTVLH